MVATAEENPFHHHYHHHPHHLHKGFHKSSHNQEHHRHHHHPHHQEKPTSSTHTTTTSPTLSTRTHVSSSPSFHSTSSSCRGGNPTTSTAIASPTKTTSTVTTLYASSMCKLLLFAPRRHVVHTLLLALVHSLLSTPAALLLVFHQHQHSVAGVAGKSLTTSTKSSSCTYTVVINEFDSSRCSSMNPYVQADGTGMEKEHSSFGMMKDGGYGKPGSASSSSSSSSTAVAAQLESVENALLEEMVKSREINSTLNRHASMLASAQRTLEAYKANFTHVFRAMVNMERRLHHQRRINRSLNKKLSNVILDVVEVNNVLTRKTPKGSAKKSQTKSFQVESVGKVRSCVGVANAEKVYKDCADVYDSGHHRSDVYYIKPLYSACPIPVWCDMDSPKAGWLLIQRRQDGSVDFNRQWADYRDGFGDVISEHWLGNDNIFLLTNQARYQLRIDLWDFSGNRVHALYSNFKIEGERDHYRLHVSGYSGSAKDSLIRHNNKPFSTGDADHDNRRDASCATEWEAGWWFDKCWYALLNGPYQNQSDVRYKGISWKSWKFEQLRGAEMKIRPAHHHGRR